MGAEFFWDRVPFFRLLIPFLGGILFEIYTQCTIPGLLFVLLLLFSLLLAISYIRALALSYRFRFLFGGILTLALFLCGVYVVMLRSQYRNADHFSRSTAQGAICLVQLDAPFLEKDRSLKVVMNVLAVQSEGRWKSTSGKAMFYIEKDDRSLRLDYGDRLIVKAAFAPIPAPANPSEFNYKQFLYFHNIYQQSYVNSKQWVQVDGNGGSSILRWSYRLRAYLLGLLKESGLKGDEYAVAAALVLGYTDKLDADVISAYASTGALHVLSVSGLHVGIIYFVFNLIFSFLDKRKRGNVIKAGVLLLLIWFYATLTGLSPSVLRSATMFSFIIFAKAFRYNTDIFNTLAVSCFVLLLYDPFLIMEVGFQLSFLAVFGIVFLQPSIYEWWQPRNYLLDKIWALTAVSLAAQLATFPLGLLYFHQFPNLFLFSNLVVIPISTVVLYVGLLLFFVSKIVFLGWLTAKLLYYAVLWLNASVKFMEQLPYSIILGVSVTILETWILYFFITFGAAFFFLKKRKYLVTALGCLLLFLALQVKEHIVQQYQHRIVVYSIPHTSAIDLVEGHHTTFVSDSAFMQNKSRMLFHVVHNWWDNGLSAQRMADKKKDLESGAVLKKGPFLAFGDKRLLLADSSLVLPSGKKEMKIDYVLISGTPRFCLSRLKEIFHPGLIIFDRSSPAGRVARWKKDCAKLQLPYYDVGEKGAFVQEL